METPEQRAAKLQAARAQCIEALRAAEAKIAKNDGPATWQTYLPARYRGTVTGDPTATARELFTGPQPPESSSLRRLTPEMMARVDAACAADLRAPLATSVPETVKGPAKKRQKKTPEEKAAAAAKREANKGAKKPGAKGAAAAPAAPAPPLPTVSPIARRAFEACWDLEFGPDKTNPFRTRLTEEACRLLGVADYFTMVREVMDLALIRQKLNADAYRSDDLLRRDVRLCAANARAYHGGESDLAAYGDRMASVFDTVLNGGTVAMDVG